MPRPLPRRQNPHRCAGRSLGHDVATTAPHWPLRLSSACTAAVRERIVVTVEVKNQGQADLKPGVFVPLNIRFEGNGIRRDVTSRNYNEGIPAGKTALITKSINGPWVGDISFSAEVAGTYDLTVAVDKQNEISEASKTNNQQTAGVAYAMPPTMGAFALERSIRSYASVASADSLVKIIRKAHAAGNSRLIQVIAEGWNYDRKNISVSKADQQWLNKVLKPSDDKLIKLMEAWSVKSATPVVQSRQIKIKAVKEAMKFDITEFSVKPGEQIELVFEIPDAGHAIHEESPEVCSKIIANLAKTL